MLYINIIVTKCPIGRNELKIALAFDRFHQIAIYKRI